MVYNAKKRLFSVSYRPLSVVRLRKSRFLRNKSTGDAKLLLIGCRPNLQRTEPPLSQPRCSDERYAIGAVGRQLATDAATGTESREAAG